MHQLLGWRRFWRSEVNLGYSSRSLRRFKIGVVRFVTHTRGEQARGKLLHVRVVIPKRVVITLALDSNAVFGPCEFVLQAQEVFVGFQLGIILGNGQETP